VKARYETGHMSSTSVIEGDQRVPRSLNSGASSIRRKKHRKMGLKTLNEIRMRTKFVIR
jgi:hypothetical protein